MLRAAALTAAACLLAACGSRTTTADKTSPVEATPNSPTTAGELFPSSTMTTSPTTTPGRTTPTTTSSAAAATKAPHVIPLTITFAQQKTGLKVDATDIGRFIVDGVDHERNILDAANWHIAAQCDNLVNGAIRVGVIKSDEMSAIGAARQGKPIAENSFKTLLECPAD